MSDDPFPAVLIIDDNAKIGRLVAEIFTRLGFSEVDTTRSGVEALDMVRNGNYGLIVCDLDLEPIDGLQILRTIKSDEHLFKIAFILTETSITFEQVTAAHAAGVDAFLLKPFDIALLKSKLKTVLRRQARRRRIVNDWTQKSLHEVL
ncbi:response regulator [Salinarimonas sp.]|uniref:response regulator n=1 Tax=Salinarimonas sp. TaxID=2766526 RepID=UPI00391DF0C3